MNPSRSALLFFTVASLGIAGETEPKTEPKTEIDVYPPVSAAVMREGLGFNVDPRNPRELELAKQSGAVEIRIQSGWEQTERKAGALKLPDDVARSLDDCKRLGLEPLILAAYGPAHPQRAAYSLAEAAPKGTRSLKLAPGGASLEQMDPTSDFVRVSRKRPDGKMESPQFLAPGFQSYAGAAISAVDVAGRKLTLGAKLTEDLPAGTAVQINRLLYPAARSTDSSDPYVAAYVRYARFLAEQIAARGLKGRVELWNEPAWAHDRTDSFGCMFEDPAERKARGGCLSWNPGFHKALVAMPPIQGVTFQSGGTHKTGFHTVLRGLFDHDPQGIGFAITKEQVDKIIDAESFHPYGANPERHLMKPECLTHGRGTSFRDKAFFEKCSSPGMDVGANLKWAIRLAEELREKNGWTIHRTISEAGIITDDQSAKTRYVIRHFLSDAALGFERVDFYRLVGLPGGELDMGFALAAPDKKGMPKPLPALDALRDLIRDKLGPFSAKPDLRAAPRFEISGYDGKWPLMVVPVLGRKPGAKQDTLWVALWQRTFVPPSGKERDWVAMPRPAAAPLTLRLANGKGSFERAWNAVGGPAPKVEKEKSGALRLSVADEPLFLDFGSFGQTDP